MAKLSLSAIRDLKAGLHAGRMTAFLRRKGAVVGKNLRCEEAPRVWIGWQSRLTIGDNVQIGANSRFHVDLGGSITIEDGVELRPNVHLHSGKGHLLIRSNTAVADGTIVYCGGSVTIGSDVMVAAYTFIADVDHIYSDPDTPMKNQGITDPEPVLIDDGSWLGTKVTVMPGVTVGKGSIVAANAVVLRDVPPYEIWGGIPAKFIKLRPGCASKQWD